MMLGDVAALTDPAAKPFDFCVIGGGPAGITLALELAKTGRSVCLIESGREILDPDIQELYDAVDVGAYSGPVAGRLRQLGGSSNHWGGRCAPLDALDMERKDWMPEATWPISRSDLDPFYERARHYCGFAGAPPPDAETAARVLRNHSILSEIIEPSVWWYTPQDDGNGYNFAKRYRQALLSAPNIQLFLDSSVVDFALDASRHRVDGVDIQSIEGIKAKIAARAFVLSCGGIENVRLLLSGAAGQPIGNRTDQLGRYVMQHGRAVAAIALPTRPRSPLPKLFNFNIFNQAPEVPRCQVGLQLTGKARQDLSLPNASMMFDYHYPMHAGALALHKLADDMHQGVAHAGDIGADLRGVLGDLAFIEEMIARPLHHGLQTLEHAEMIVDLEQVPDRDSRITLDDQRDKLGLRKARIDWRLSEQLRQTARAITLAAGAEFARQGLARCRLEPWLERTDVALGDVVMPTFHFLGGTRMAASADKGVVDPDCRVHEMDNLFVAGSSVFPSGGHVNPTLTIVALAVRLADRLIARL